jgi:putative methionine-R-sulfoxide reductase with GAF domain
MGHTDDVTSVYGTTILSISSGSQGNVIINGSLPDYDSCSDGARNHVFVGVFDADRLREALDITSPAAERFKLFSLAKRDSDQTVLVKIGYHSVRLDIEQLLGLIEGCGIKVR